MNYWRGLSDFAETKGWCIKAENDSWYRVTQVAMPPFLVFILFNDASVATFPINWVTMKCKLWRYYLSTGNCLLCLSIREVLNACCLLLVECHSCHQCISQNIQPTASLFHCRPHIHCRCAVQQHLYIITISPKLPGLFQSIQTLRHFFCKWLKQVAQLSQRDRAAVWVSCGANINVVFRIQRTLL